MKLIIKLFTLLLPLSLPFNLSFSQGDQTPPPPVVYEGLEFPELPYESFFVMN